MSDIHKTIVTVSIWIAVGLIDFGVALSNIEQGNALGWPFMLPLIIALLGTVFIWTVPALLERRVGVSHHSESKSKRDSGAMMAVLMELMDEDERAVLKQKLQQRLMRDVGYINDGEIPDDRMSLESLMQDEEDYLQR
jgi:hypothetical protein